MERPKNGGRKICLRMSQNQAIELYIHIPFCARKCSYCDFLSFPSGRDSQNRYLAALQKEIGAAVGKEYKVRSVFFGGGTPSLLAVGAVSDLMAAVRASYVLLPDAEVTIEANPCTVTAEKLAEYREAGINRISLGCQSLDNGILKTLGRLHTAETFFRSVELVKTAGFSNISVDLMSGLPDLTRALWRETLKTVAGLGVPHLSAYSLILEEGTPLFERQADFHFPDEEELAGMYEDTAEILAGYGLARYEISNYAKPGYESRHNLGYWTGVPYLGFGLGASSCFPKQEEVFSGRRERNKHTDGPSEMPGRELSGEHAESICGNQTAECDRKWVRYRNTEDFREYLNSSADSGKIQSDVQILTQEELYAEYMILGLRLVRGISCAGFRARFGRSVFDVFQVPLEKHLKAGTLVRESDRIRIPEKYLFVSNHILVDFM